GRRDAGPRVWAVSPSYTVPSEGSPGRWPPDRTDAEPARGAKQLQPARHSDARAVGPASCEGVGGGEGDGGATGHTRGGQPRAQHPAAQGGRDVYQRGDVQLGTGRPRSD